MNYRLHAYLDGMRDAAAGATQASAILALFVSLAFNGNVLVWLVCFAALWLVIMACASLDYLRGLRARRLAAERRRDPGLRVFRAP